MNSTFFLFMQVSFAMQCSWNSPDVARCVLNRRSSTRSGFWIWFNYTGRSWCPNLSQAKRATVPEEIGKEYSCLVYKSFPSPSSLCLKFACDAFHGRNPQVFASQHYVLNNSLRRVCLKHRKQCLRSQKTDVNNWKDCLLQMQLLWARAIVRISADLWARSQEIGRASCRERVCQYV